MYFSNMYAAKSRKLLISGKSPLAGTSGTTIKNLSVTDQLLNYAAIGNFAISLSSSNQAADIAAGTGARQVIVYGLGVDYLPLSEVVTLNATDGRTAANGAAIFSRVFAAEVIASGTGLGNAGDLYVSKIGTALTSGVPTALTTTWVKILVGESYGTNGFYTVPANRTARIAQMYLHTRAQIATISIQSLEPSTNTLGTAWSMGMPATTPVVLVEELPVRFPPRTDIYLRVTAATTLAIVTAQMLVALDTV